jgi:hypothetical protein
MRKRETFEVLAVVLTAGLHFVFYDLLPGRGVFILVTIVGWAAYFVFRIRRQPVNLRLFGLSAEGLGPSVAARLPSWLLGSWRAWWWASQGAAFGWYPTC